LPLPLNLGRLRRIFARARGVDLARATLTDWVGQAARLLILHADAFAGFHTLYEGERVLDAACLSPVRRKMWDSTSASTARLARWRTKR
jgi:hypothetical protein